MENIGPQLPPDLEFRTGASPSADDIDDSEKFDFVPTDPFDDRKVAETQKSDAEEEDEVEIEEASMCPLLPPDFCPDEPRSGEFMRPENGNAAAASFGPSLPPDLVTSSVASASARTESPEFYGPALPPDLLPDAEVPIQDLEETEIGPTLPSEAGSESYEDRLLELKKRQAFEESKKRREEWMTELPTQLKAYGLGARTFSRKGVIKESDEDRAAVWTKLPSELAECSASTSSGKKVEKNKKLKRSLKERDDALEKKAQEMNKSRTESLVEMHTKKKKAEKDPEESQERRPFNREVDLSLSCLSGEKTRQLVERAAELGSRFNHSSTEQKYL